MVVMSKQLFNQVVRDQTCTQLFHPWSESCIGALPKSFIDSVKGSLHFYTILYSVQMAMQAKQLKHKSTWVRMGEYFCRSFMLGVIVPFSFITVNCMFRNLLGLHINYFTSLLLPLTTSGIAIYLEPPKRRSLVITHFVNQLIEYWMRCLRRAGYLSITKSKQVLMFMIGSSLLFYLMRLEGERKERTPLLWLFTAEKVNNKSDDSTNVCPHKGPCQKYILKGFGTYFSVGLGISLAKLILPKIRTPLRALSSIQDKHFKMALFFSSYIGIYRAVICYLCRKNGQDSALYALPAGCLAGLSMVFNPGLGLAIASITGAMKLYTTILYEKKVLPENVPLPELLYCVSQGLLFSSRFVDYQACPPYIKNLTDTVSHGHCEAVYRRTIELAKKMAVS